MPLRLLTLLLLAAIVGSAAVECQTTQRGRRARSTRPPARVAFWIKVDVPRPYVLTIHEANARDEREAVSSADDADGYVWEVRDNDGRIVAQGRGPKTTTARSEWDAQGRADPIEVEMQTGGVGGIAPNIGGTIVVYDAVAHAMTGVRVAQLSLPVVPAGVLVCFGAPTPEPLKCVE
ncbi:hypothetical protein [Luteitalea sp.]|jgi:hypothetical protein